MLCVRSQELDNIYELYVYVKKQAVIIPNKTIKIKCKYEFFHMYTKKKFFELIIIIN